MLWAVAIYFLFTSRERPLKARRKGEDLPIYQRAVFERALEDLPDPGDTCEESITICRSGATMVFLRVPTICERARGQGCYWKWELNGRVEDKVSDC